LKYLGEEETIEAELVYRGSEHGWEFKDFHRCADHKGATITLFKIEDSDCIGGYTKQSWHERSNQLDDWYVQDV